MYFGEYERTVDHKGRLVLPAHLLVNDEDGAWGSVMVVKGDMAGDVSLSCLFVYDLKTWNAVLDEAYRSFDDEESRLFMHRALSDAHLSEVDNMKRITIPSSLLEHAQIEKRSTIVGMFNHLELWSPETWQRHVQQLQDLELKSISDLSRARIREVS